MEAGARVTGLVDELIDLFNRRSDDLPERLFDRQTQFVLNGVPFEETVGRPPADPLVLMLTRGPAGYRLIAKALVHAIPDACIERGELFTEAAENTVLVRWQCWLSGHLRGTGAPVNAVFDAEFSLPPAGPVKRASVTIAAAHLTPIREARMRP